MTDWLTMHREDETETRSIPEGCYGENYQDLKHILEAVDDVTLISIIDPSGTILYVNDYFCEVFGYLRSELIGSEYGLIKSHLHSQAFYDELWATIQRGESWTGEIKNQHKNGRIFWLQTAITPVLHENNSIKHYIAIRKDISESKRIGEKERNKIEDNYEAVINNLDNMVMRIEDDQRGNYPVALIGGKMIDKLQIEKREVLGTSVEDVLRLSNENKQLFLRQLRAAFQGETTGLELEYQKWSLYVNFASIMEDGDIVSVTASFSDITPLKKTQDAMRDLAFQDPLTELPNRRQFECDLSDLIAERKQSHDPIAILLIDMDQFKNINDSLGHATGDRFLLIASERMNRIPAGEHVKYKLYHLGGDEFVFLISRFSDGTVKPFINQIVQLFHEPFPYFEGDIHLQVSIGGTFYPDYAQSAEDIMKQVDMAVMTAKKSGGQKYQFFTGDMQKQFSEYVILERDLRKALEVKDEFELYYQPIFNKAGEADLAEVLIRWNHPHSGLISPAEFIPVAEKSGLIVPLGQWIMKKSSPGCESLV
ncbi:diguanylate cyclase domain-containing protein [Salisediminibacterium beveridgei]|uniref:diguanylate cyclase domain-containing protein n=1 Tax=Salisediminibacterium beveridgei TaxID=632773 RepID=UPI0018DCE9E1|nr:diguanylate cyclase [Salisediminibacterium beveridgei]